ncbi:type IV toxin-antitoxin system AbiEi family antitoxin domain-containing protein [Cellulomonas sp. CW35]|uniref:type IV toxin-antitoxin system AbiEi family antitoxin domain-containing protein n=1 Tax=Cellulomonas sp. CW35 TaxID=3458249 RepID=UPI0040334B80
MTKNVKEGTARAGDLPSRAFTLADAERLGLSRSAVYRLASRGDLERVAPGVYRRAEDDLTYDPDLLGAAIRAPRATICLTSALVLHGLTDEIPAATDLAVPRRARRPATSPAIRWHQWDEATFEIGRGPHTIEGTDTVIGLYSAERSIVDAFRTRNVAGYETATEALRRWLRKRGSHPVNVLAVAERLPRARGPLLEALQYLT